MSQKKKSKNGAKPQTLRERRTQNYSQLENRDRSPSTHRGSTANNELSVSAEANASSGDGVNRNTSIRSIMTLPPYSPAARESEQVLGREGERAGIDTVLEYPESTDVEESRRDQEMESLYQIRLARRNEAADRERRRQERRDARARGDETTLLELRQRAEDAAENSVSGQLMAEHLLTNRERRVSSVQYADLGVARHDGSRLRANSTESDSRPLLSSADSQYSASTRDPHHRNRSASSVLSISTGGSDDDNDRRGVAAPSSHRRPSGASAAPSSHSAGDFEVIELAHTVSSPRSLSASRGSSHTLHTAVSSAAATPGSDLGEQPMPAIAPPDYDAPPNYESPVDPRAAPQLPRLPSLDRLPSIQVTVTSPTRENSGGVVAEEERGRQQR